MPLRQARALKDEFSRNQKRQIVGKRTDPRVSIEAGKADAKPIVQYQEIHRPSDFGIDSRPASTRWSDIARGPSKAEVLAHLAKLASFLAPTK